MAKKPAQKFDTSVIPEHVAYFRNKENRPSYSWKDTAPEDHAFAFTVAKATSTEVLTTIRQAVDEAIAKGETAEMFKAKLMPQLVALGWWGRKEMADPVTGEIRTVELGSPRRLDTIFQTNTRVAYAAGAWERAQRTKHLAPYLRYRLGPSEQHRPDHERLEDTILKIDDPFWQARYPPNGFGCKCWTAQLTEAQAKALGYDPEKPAPDLGTRTYVNARTGERLTLPRGVDPGFGVNPGQLRHKVLAMHLAGKLDRAPPEISKVVVRDVVTSQHFQLIQTGKVKGAAPVAILPQAAQQRLGTSTRTVLLSDDTAEKQAGKRQPNSAGRASPGHPELKATDYVRVQELVESGERLSDKANHETFIKKIDDAYWSVTIKATGNREQVYLQSLHRLKESDVVRRRKRSVTGG